MIKLVLDTDFKSLKPLTCDLPDFVILTGLNGAGKTQLLKAIEEDRMIILDESSVNLNPKKYVTPQTLEPNNSTIVTSEQTNSKVLNLWNSYNQAYLPQKKQNPSLKFEQIFGNGSPLIRVIEKIAKDAKKDIDNLVVADFYYFYPIQDGLDQTDVFYQNFSLFFKRYQDKYDENRYRQYLHDIKGQDTSYMTEEQFFSTFGEPPWDLVNEIIIGANLDYHINTPVELNRDAPFELKLVNNFNGVEINFSDLSSGEKVLMSLGLALYNSNLDIDFPKVLLMDEPDASLHPSMSKKFIDVIQNVFVKDKGVKVIVTTHSPSTVALAPEKAIYIVNKNEPRVEKASKDKALKILTSGVPSFSVNYENRRQVFVESTNDMLFYEKLYKNLSDQLETEISLCFISSGDSKTDKNGIKISNCGQVINITKALRTAGNKFVWGIIDWDTKNVSSDYVEVLGNGKRYSIENYILDPIFISLLLYREKMVSNEDLGLEAYENYMNIKKWDNSRIQLIADYTINKVKDKLQPTSETKISTQLINGYEIKIPDWYLLHQGHNLENLILEVFPQLNAIKKKKEEALKLAILEKVVDDLPELLPIDFVELFRKVQTI